GRLQEFADVLPPVDGVGVRGQVKRVLGVEVDHLVQLAGVPQAGPLLAQPADDDLNVLLDLCGSDRAHGHWLFGEGERAQNRPFDRCLQRLRGLWTLVTSPHRSVVPFSPIGHLPSRTFVCKSLQEKALPFQEMPVYWPRRITPRWRKKERI